MTPTSRQNASRSHKARRSVLKPPVILHGCRIEQFAVRDRSMPFAGHGLLFHGDNEVGPLPRLALGRDRSNEVLLFHCDTRWRVMGTSGGYATLREAKALAERFYRGISKAWVRTGYTKAQASRYLERLGPKCSLCSKLWLDVEKMIEIKSARVVVCDSCIKELHRLVSAR